MSYDYTMKLEFQNKNLQERIFELSNIVNIQNQKLIELSNFIQTTTNTISNIKTKNNELKKDNEQLNDKYRCSICYENCKNVILEPCLHFVCCDKCSDNLTECPICRGEFQSRLLVFGV